MVNVYLNLSIFIVFLKNRNFITKIRGSKVTDYAALTNSSDNTLFFTTYNLAPLDMYTGLSQVYCIESEGIINYFING